MSPVISPVVPGERHSSCSTLVVPLTPEQAEEVLAEQQRWQTSPRAVAPSSEGFVYCPRCMVMTTYSTYVALEG